MGRRRRGRMGSLGDQAFEQTNEELADREAKLLLETDIDWGDIRPQIDGGEVYEQLMMEVREATNNNEDLVQLKERIQSMGKEGVQMVRKVIAIAT